MATSNSTDFTQTRDEIITDCLWLMGIIGEEDTPNANQISKCSNILNKMIKGWEAQGIHLWTQQEGALFLSSGKQYYDITGSGTDIAGDDVIFTTLTLDASGASLSVASVEEMNVLDNIGIKLDNNTIFWTTIASLGSLSINLTDSLPSQASASNNVFVFTNRVDRPLWITSARYRSAGGYERPLLPKGRDDFMRIPNKSAIGPANTVYYSPKVNSSRLYVWPTCDDVGDCIRFSYTRRIQDFDAGNNTPDLPQEWLEAITYNLCIRVAPAFGLSTQKLNPDISIIAINSLEEMKLMDGEDGSTKIVPNYRYDY